MDTHLFTSSRADGTVCVATRRRVSGHLDADMPCGFPAGHPIHETLEQYGARRSAERPDPLHVSSSATGQVRVSGGRPPIVAQPPAMPPITPAEARTGISDRAAATLADVADLRSALGTLDAGGLRDDETLLAALDRIEQALRAGGAA